MLFDVATKPKEQRELEAKFLELKYDLTTLENDFEIQFTVDITLLSVILLIFLLFRFQLLIRITSIIG